MRLLAALASAALVAGCSEAVSPPPTTSLATATTAGIATTETTSPSASAPPSVSAPTSLRPPDAEQRKRLESDVASVAVERPPGSAGSEATKKLIVGRLSSLGYVPTLEPFEGGTNILAERRGSGAGARVILSAHFDHIRGCKGADDNASGVAVVLEAARQLRDVTGARTLTLAFWDREEDGLLGSMFHAAEARRRGEEILVAFSLDSVGFASSAPNSQQLPGALEMILPEVFARAKANGFKADFVAALGDVEAAPSLAQFESFGVAFEQPAFGVPLPGLARLALADAARSDHASFWLNGFSGVMITDTANFRNPRYHCGAGPDDPNTLDYDFLNRVASVVIATTRAAIDRP